MNGGQGEARSAEPIRLSAGWNAWLGCVLLAAGAITASYGLTVRAVDAGEGAGAGPLLLVMGAAIVLLGAFRIKAAADQLASQEAPS